MDEIVQLDNLNSWILKDIDWKKYCLKNEESWSIHVVQVASPSAVVTLNQIIIYYIWQIGICFWQVSVFLFNKKHTRMFGFVLTEPVIFIRNGNFREYFLQMGALKNGHSRRPRSQITSDSDSDYRHCLIEEEGTL